MKTFNSKILWLTMLLAVFGLWSCSDEMQTETEMVAPDNVPSGIHTDFVRSYPDAAEVVWNISGEYAVASFIANASRAEAGEHSTVWYWLNDNQKKMHSAPILFTDLPSAVTEAFYAGEYGSLTPSERAHVITRYVNNNVECIYKIQAKGALEGTVSTAVKLYYTEEGALVKSSTEVVYDESFAHKDELDELKDWLPQTPADFVSAYVEANYPGARYLYIHEGRNMTKAKILDGHTVRTLLFDAEGVWMSTATEIDDHYIPAEVIAAFRMTEYADWHIGKVTEYVTAADGSYYLLSLEKGKNKYELRIEADGAVTVDPGTPSEPENPGSASDDTAYLSKADIEGYIQAKYPGATVRKYDFDDDDAEIEIVYNTHKIKVEFELHAQGYLWSRSEWDFDIRDAASIPAVVSDTISARYSGYKLEYLSYLETATDAPCYEAGLKSPKTKKVLKVKMDEQGNVIAEYGSR